MPRGKNLTPEGRKKISETHKGKIVPREVVERMRASLKGREITWADKISLSKKGKPHLNQRGEKSPHWKGGVTPENRRIRTSFEYKFWRTSVFERDNYACVWCGLKSGNGIAVILHADHIKPFAYFPELRLALDNGRTLCIECHKTTDTYAGKIRNKKHDYQF